MNDDELKLIFEKECFEFFEERKRQGFIDPNDTGDGTPEGLFWKDEKGNYGVRMFNAAWWGFRVAYKSMGKVT